MRKFILFALLLNFVISCSSDDPNPGQEVNPSTGSPVILDLNQVPYPTLSTYNFFKQPMKGQVPVIGVIPYEPINTLFTDYAHKNRYIWMPQGVKAEYVSDNQPLNFPDGTAIIKNFYYDNVVPNNNTKILETRLMIRKNGEWMFINYVWNEAQTEAYLDLSGSDVPIEWIENGTTKSANYRIPSESECFICHKIEEEKVLIGPKPRNLNKVFNYADGPMNQLEKLIRHGYLNGDNLPQDLAAIPDWTHTSNPVEVRMRSYLDANCAHCHQEMAHCSYTPIRLDWDMTASPENLGLCVPVSEPLPGMDYTIMPGNANRSGMYYRFTSDDVSTKMPLIGTSIVHEEAAELMNEWINSLPAQNCN